MATPRTEGRTYRINKRTSHITIELESRPKAAAPPKGAGRARKGTSAKGRASQKEGAR